MINAPASQAQGFLPATSYGAIVDARYVNTGELLVRGIDGSASYDLSVLGDPLSLRTDVSWLVDYKRKVTPASLPVDLAGVAAYPADLRLRATATWTHGPWATALSVNRVGDLNGEAGQTIDAWTTFDLNLRRTVTVFGASPLTLSLNVQNLLDEDPPFYDNPVAVAYDPTNADALGRVVSLQLTQRW
ncbi:MAG: hypothetical protein BGN86_06020 [Caulobacterales bacterium 68-7]|nr:MAG: hypothetical protein BGN86_06020 [Caulobacterales bacterium 68-7]